MRSFISKKFEFLLGSIINSLHKNCDQTFMIKLGANFTFLKIKSQQNYMAKLYTLYDRWS